MGDEEDGKFVNGVNLTYVCGICMQSTVQPGEESIVILEGGATVHNTCWVVDIHFAERNRRRARFLRQLLGHTARQRGASSSSSSSSGWGSD